MHQQPHHDYDHDDRYQPEDPGQPYETQGAQGVHGVHGAQEPYATRRKLRRPVVVAVAALLAAALVPVVADRLATARVEARTAEAFQEGMDTPRRPDVHVRGIPVLTQLASGTLRHVDITAHDIPADGSARPLPVSSLTLRLNGLRKSDDDSEARARSATATAALSYADVSDALGLEVTRGTRPGEIGARVLLPFGTEATVSTTVSAASGNRVAFRDFRVTGGALPAAGQALLDRVFEQPIPLRSIPEGLRLRSVTTTATGIDAHFSGESVTFRPDDTARNGWASENPSHDA
ncbi:DUF2993 domain-containing protein [Streptomyces sp. NPDC087903]|uniref:LmeA family phospholipid-binding protein n=1 Tax=Streptomyces sp. NPDC087903 TaxID=3365819 RepID=UPI003820A763